jgi:hypothetical protein
VAAVVVSALAWTGALAVLHRLAAREYGGVAARRAVWAVAVFPSAFFLGVGYNMSVALLLCVGCVYALRRERWWLAGALGAVATATRSSALLLVAAFAVEYLRRIGWRPSRYLLAGALIPAGLAAYMTYLWLAFGDALAFVHAQRAWGRHPDWPWVGVVTALGRAADPAEGAGMRFFNLLDPLVVIVGVLLMTPLLRDPDRRVFGVLGLGWLGLIVLVPSANPTLPTLTSATRLMLEIFPIFVVLGGLRLGRLSRVVLVGLAGALQALLCALFVLGNWAG